MAKTFLPFAFALFAAIGNVFYVLGSRKTTDAPNPVLFTFVAMTVGLALFLAAWLAFGTRGTGEFLRRSLLLTTATGTWLLRESLNGYGIASIIAALASVAFFWLSKH